MFTKFKVAISGNIIETYEFEKEFWQGALPQSSSRSNKKIKTKNGQRTERSFFRAQTRLKKLINCNADLASDELRPRFVTLTFAENIVDIKRANFEHTKFIRKFNSYLKSKKFGCKLSYVAVIEFQKRGAVHYHILFFNLPYFPNMYDVMEKLWGNGWVISKKIDKVKNLGTYVCKYMTKNINDKRLYGQKCYFASMGLKKPREIYNESVVKFVTEFMPEEIMPFEKIRQTKDRGAYVYRRYDMTEHQEAKNDLLAFIK
jgi:hypothetical protein